MLTKEADSKNLSYIDHLKELRSRVIRIIFIYFVFFIVIYSFSDYIYHILALPLIDATGGNAKFIYTNLAEAFFAKITLSLKTAFIIIIPFISLEIYFFVSPGLYKEEKDFFRSSIIAFNLLLFCGFAFLYYYVMPAAFKFFVSFQQNMSNYSLNLEAKIGEYIELVSSLMFSFGIAFELPIFILSLVFIGILSYKSLASQRRIAIVMIFIIAGIITPPDVLSQLLLAFPMIALYEITIIAAKKLEFRRKRA